MSKIIDVCAYNGERELFEIRYNILKDFVDEFRVFEFDKTFSGNPKKSTFNQHWHKVNHYFVTEDIWSKYKDLAISSPNTDYGKGAKHWITEFCQKESIKDFLTDLKDKDIIYIGDCDEIPNADIPNLDKEIVKLKLAVYAYWLNNRSSEKFWGTIVGKYKVIKNECLNHLRQNPNIKTSLEHGWHFTSLAPYLKQKLQDSYTEETYATEQILSSLEKNVSENKDFLGRGFVYRIDEEDWPLWLIENKEKYRYLMI